MRLLRWSIRELRGQKAFVLLFLVNITLGLLGLGMINTWKDTFEITLSQRSREMLGADAQLSARRIFDESSVNLITDLASENNAKIGRSSVLYTMVSNQNSSRLVEVRAIDDIVPFYGTIKLDPPQSPRPIIAPGIVWIYPEIAEQLSLKIGQVLKLGNLELSVKGIIRDDPAGSWAGSSLAPRLYMFQGDLEKTGLVQKGSTIWNTFLFQQPDSLQLKKLISTLKSKLPDPGISISEHRESGDQSTRVFRYLTDYLSLVSITSLIMSGIAASWLFRQFFQTRRKANAIYICLGATRLEAVSIGVLQILFLSILASVFAAILTLLASTALLPIVKTFLPWDIHPQFQWRILGEMLLFSTGTSLVVCLPSLLQARTLSPASLLSDSTRYDGKSDRFQIFGFVLQAMFFSVLAILQARSVKAGLIFAVAIVASTCFILAISLLIKKLFRRILTIENVAFKHAFLRLSRQGKDTAPAIVAIGIAALLSTLIPSVRRNLENELEIGGNSRKPAMFIFDVQDEQKKELEDILLQNHAKLQLMSPLIRARLVSINGEEVSRFEKDGADFQESETNRSMRNRGYNLSFRSNLDTSETITKGQWVDEVYNPLQDKLPSISVEERFAERTGVKLGDVLLFDIEGVEISGQIKSLRSVKWTSFQPNFFVQFQPGVLDEAPKTWVASLGTDVFDSKMKIQTAIVNKFPNITILDVERILRRLIDLVEKTSLAISALAWISLICGLLVLTSISRQLVYERQKDLTLLKVIGADANYIRTLLLSEVTMISLLGSICGVVLGWGVSQIVAVTVFQSGLVRPSLSIVLIPCVSWCLAMALSWRTMGKIARQKADLTVISED